MLKEKILWDDIFLERLSHKSFAAFGGRIEFFSAPFSVILRSKINENGAQDL